MIMSSFLLARAVAVSVFLVQPPPSLKDTAINRAQAVTMWREVREIYKAQGVNLRLKRLSTIRPPWGAKYYTEESQGGDLIVSLWLLARERKLTKGGQVVHFLTPRSTNGYMFGMALFDVCARGHGGAVSFSTAQEQNILGVDRHDHSVAAMAHEIGHGLGAKHETSGLMKSGILADLEKEFSPESLDQITKCLEARGK